MSVKPGSRDYYAFQELWRECGHLYNQSYLNKEEQFEIVNTFRNNLVDISREGIRALRSRYNYWETNSWLKLCQEKLDEWVKDNHFESTNNQSIEDEYSRIQQKYNYLRYSKILQIIQDSGIGLGQGRGVPVVNREG